MKKAFLLQHLHLVDGGDEDVKTLGIYSSRESAEKAVVRFRGLPGFRDVPQMADPSAIGAGEGFYIDEFELDQDSWASGYQTQSPN